MRNVQLTDAERPGIQEYIRRRSCISSAGCWLWSLGTFQSGYGRANVPGRPGPVLAHRLSFSAFVGDPSGLCVLHCCDVRRCVNPSHLWLGTYGDNNRDTAQKGRNRGRTKPKLTLDGVAEVRRMRRLFPAKVVAFQFGISTTMVKLISRGEYRGV